MSYKYLKWKLFLPHFSPCGVHDVPFHLSCVSSRRAYGMAELEQNEWMIFHNIHGYARMWWWCSRGVLLHVRASKKLGNWVVCSLEWKPGRSEWWKKEPKFESQKAANIKKTEAKAVKNTSRIFYFHPILSLCRVLFTLFATAKRKKKLVSTQREHISEWVRGKASREKNWQKTHIIWRCWGAPTADRASYVNGLHSINNNTHV